MATFETMPDKQRLDILEEIILKRIQEKVGEISSKIQMEALERLEKEIVCGIDKICFDIFNDLRTDVRVNDLLTDNAREVVMRMFINGKELATNED